MTQDMSELSGGLLLGNTFHPVHDTSRIVKNVSELRTWSRRRYARAYHRLANDPNIEILEDHPRQLSVRNPQRARIKYRLKQSKRK